MARHLWSILILNILLVLMMSFGGRVAPAWAAKADFAIGLKAQYATLSRTLKRDGVRVDTADTDPAWMQGAILNGTYGRFFMGASFVRTNFIEGEAPGSTGIVTSGKRHNVEVSEFNLAGGYTLAQGVSPYIVYWRHSQETDRDCAGCIREVNISDLGVGLLLNYPLPQSRWAAYINGALIKGISVEGGLSYAGIRWPVVGVVGYAYRRIDYDSGEGNCSEPGFDCFRDRDILRGPVMMIYYTF